MNRNIGGNFSRTSQNDVNSLPVSNNPVYQVSLSKVDGKMEGPKEGPKERDEEIQKGDPVEGYKLNQKEKKIKGRVLSVEKNNKGRIQYYFIMDEKGNRVKIDRKNVSKLNFHDGNKINENKEYVLRYEDF